MEKYLSVYNEFISDDDNNDFIGCLKIFNDILKSNNKKKIHKLEEYAINRSVLEILKKCYFEKINV